MSGTGLDAVRLGMAVGHPRGAAGTLGFFARQGQKHVLVSASHAIAPQGWRSGDLVHLATIGAAIQPAPSSRIARLLASDGKAAVAELLPHAHGSSNRLPPGVLPGGTEAMITSFVPAASAQLGQRVAKIGAASGITFGVLTALLARVIVGGRDSAEEIADTLEVTAETGEFCRPGDSGALVFTLDPPAALGIVYAATAATDDSQRVVVLPIEPILSAFGLSLPT